jgi:alpha-galactosidase
MPLPDIAARARTLYRRSRLGFIGVAALAVTATTAATAFAVPAIERASSDSGSAAAAVQPATAAQDSTASATGAATPSSTASASKSPTPAPSSTAALTHGTTALAVGSAATTPQSPASTHRYVLPSNGLAATPPMGWNDWYQYRCGVTENEVIANAQALVSSGLAKLGYDYVNLDDCWMATARDASGNLQADPTRFPDGIAWLASQLHGMGLKLGVYESLGTTTCQNLPGSYGHYQQDANTFASWGVDYLKFDYCGTIPSGTTSANLESLHQQMAQALRATGRPIVFSEELPIAAGNANPSNANYLPYVTVSSQIANMWRVAPDETTSFATTVFGHLTNDLPLWSYAHPGAWNDLDMLLTGNTAYNYTVQQQQTQMSIWAELASPLIVSGDMTNMTSDTSRILGNAAVIAVDQDRLGRQGNLVGTSGTVDIVAKPLANGNVALLLANTGTAAQSVSVNVAALGINRAASYSVRDLWAGTTQQTAGTITESVPAQSATLLQVAALATPVASPAPITSGRP